MMKQSWKGHKNKIKKEVISNTIQVYVRFRPDKNKSGIKFYRILEKNRSKSTSKKEESNNNIDIDQCKDENVHCKEENLEKLRQQQVGIIEVTNDSKNTNKVDHSQYSSHSLQSGNAKVGFTSVFKVKDVFDTNASQEDIFNKCGKPMLDSFMDGFNVTFLAYGQTGSGKTYTMMGKLNNFTNISNHTKKLTSISTSFITNGSILWKGGCNERGLFIRIVEEIFRKIRMKNKEYNAVNDNITNKSDKVNENEERKCRYIKISVAMSAVEIYNEHVRDLLPPNTDASMLFGSIPFFSMDAESSGINGQDKDKSQTNAISLDLPIYEDKETGLTYIHGLSKIEIQNEEEAFSLLNRAIFNRHYSKHDINHESSRSHCIYTLSLTTRAFQYKHGHLNGNAAQFGEGEDEKSICSTLTSKLHVVDLAGTEKVIHTNSSGNLLREAGYINKSLSTLEHVVLALTDQGRKHIPYRSSKLTYYLKDSLSGKSKTCLIANIWPVSKHIDQTLSTLRFASRMGMIKDKSTVCKLNALNQYVKNSRAQKMSTVPNSNRHIEKEKHEKVFEKETDLNISKDSTHIRMKQAENNEKIQIPSNISLSLQSIKQKLLKFINEQSTKISGDIYHKPKSSTPSQDNVDEHKFREKNFEELSTFLFDVHQFVHLWTPDKPYDICSKDGKAAERNFSITRHTNICNSTVKFETVMKELREINGKKMKGNENFNVNINSKEMHVNTSKRNFNIMKNTNEEYEVDSLEKDQSQLDQSESLDLNDLATQNSVPSDNSSLIKVSSVEDGKIKKNMNEKFLQFRCTVEGQHLLTDLNKTKRKIKQKRKEHQETVTKINTVVDNILKFTKDMRYENKSASGGEAFPFIDQTIYENQEREASGITLQSLVSRKPYTKDERNALHLQKALYRQYKVALDDIQFSISTLYENKKEIIEKIKISFRDIIQEERQQQTSSPDLENIMSKYHPCKSLPKLPTIKLKHDDAPPFNRIDKIRLKQGGKIFS